MKKMQEDAFSSLHPVTNFIFLTVEVGVVALSSNPILQGIALLGALIYGRVLLGKRIWRQLLGVLPFALFVAVVNPLFSHQGATILGYFKDGNPITLESILFGGGMGLLILSMLCWFLIWNQIMTADKWIHLFGKVLPGFGLLLSMVFRFVPKLKKQYHQSQFVQPDCSPFKRFSMLVTWGLETSVDTADSMAARGYGLHRRRNFSIFHFRFADGVFLLWIGILTLFLVYVIQTGKLVFYYYPVLVVFGEPGWMQLGYAAFGLLSLLPVVFEWEEQKRWNYLQSKI
ncbi:MAG: energy-coupling factor transporter transmembrane component T [Lachnospiraceae bacterium]|nr:energy-coupling factor transporter transmembrane component T [Lachnospiraceae bacterium]